MSARWSVGCVVAVLAAGMAGGCKAHEGQKVIGYSGKANNWTKAPGDGKYALRGAGQPVTYYVQRGERIGFRNAGTNTVEAFADDNAPVQLTKSEARQAYWKYSQADKPR